jgi:hypothetical protein
MIPVSRSGPSPKLKLTIILSLGPDHERDYSAC